MIQPGLRFLGRRTEGVGWAFASAIRISQHLSANKPYVVRLVRLIVLLAVAELFAVQDDALPHGHGTVGGSAIQMLPVSSPMQGWERRWIAFDADATGLKREFLSQWKSNLLSTTMRTPVPAMAAASNAHTNQGRPRMPLAPLGYPGTHVKESAWPRVNRMRALMAHPEASRIALRDCHRTSDSIYRYLRQDLVVPFSMEGIAFNVECGDLFIGDLEAGRVEV